MRFSFAGAKSSDITVAGKAFTAMFRLDRHNIRSGVALPFEQMASLSKLVVTKDVMSRPRKKIWKL